MQIWELVILYCIFTVDPPRCSTSIVQQQNETAPPVVAAEPCGRADTDGGARPGHKTAPDFPEGKSPLDPLSVSPVKPKRPQKGRLRRIKGSQRRKPLSGSADPMMDRDGGSMVQIRSGEIIPVDSTETIRNTTNPEKVEKVETHISTAHSPDNGKAPPARTRPPTRGSGRTSFGLPMDRIGHRRLAGGRL